MSIWQIAQCGWDEKRQLDEYLADRWEPFAVTEAPHDGTHGSPKLGTTTTAGARGSATDASHRVSR